MGMHIAPGCARGHAYGPVFFWNVPGRLWKVSVVVLEGFVRYLWLFWKVLGGICGHALEYSRRLGVHMALENSTIVNVFFLISSQLHICILEIGLCFCLRISHCGLHMVPPLAKLGGEFGTRAHQNISQM